MTTETPTQKSSTTTAGSKRSDKLSNPEVVSALMQAADKFDVTTVQF